MMTQVSLMSNVIESNVLNMPHMRKKLELELTSANDRNAIVSMIQFFFYRKSSREILDSSPVCGTRHFNRK